MAHKQAGWDRATRRRLRDGYRQLQYGTAASRQRVARVAATLVGVAVALFVVGLILGVTVVGRHGGGPIQGWDNTVQTWWLHHRTGLVGVSKLIATLGDATALAVIAGGLTVVALLVVRSFRGLIPILAYLGGEALVFVIREIVHRPRPPTANYPAPGAVPGVHETTWSYPSGHAVAVTAMLFGLFGIVAIVYRLWWPWALALLASLFVAMTRLVLGVHWFSDVTFGLLLGITWGVTVAWVSQWLDFSHLKTALRRSASG